MGKASSLTIEKTDKPSMLGTEKIPRLILRFTLTTLAGLVLNSVYNLTDALFVSWGVGDNAMGGISIVFPFAILQGAISTAVGGGAASIVSRKLGEGKPAEAGEVTLNAMITFYVTAVLITILGLVFMDPLLRLMGITDELYPYAKKYFTIILAGNVFSTGFSSIIRAEGKMLYGLMIWVIPISINIILDAVFILAFGWGVSGSAAATIICQFTSFIMCVIFFSRRSVQSFKGACIKRGRIGEVLGIGLPSLVQMGSLSVITIVLNNVLREISGTLGINTFAYVSKILTYMIVPFTAVVQALAPVVGFNYGAKNSKRMKDSFMFCAALSFGYALFAVALTEAIPRYLLMIFTRNADIISAGVTALRIIAASFIFLPVPMLAGATFQAIGKKGWALLLYAAQLIFLLPFAFTLILAIGVNGVWWSYVIASVCAAALSAVVFLTQRKKIFLANEGEILPAYDDAGGDAGGLIAKNCVDECDFDVSPESNMQEGDISDIAEIEIVVREEIEKTEPET